LWAGEILRQDYAKPPTVFFRVFVVAGSFVMVLPKHPHRAPSNADPLDDGDANETIDEYPVPAETAHVVEQKEVQVPAVPGLPNWTCIQESVVVEAFEGELQRNKAQVVHKMYMVRWRRLTESFQTKMELLHQKHASPETFLRLAEIMTQATATLEEKLRSELRDAVENTQVREDYREVLLSCTAASVSSTTQYFMLLTY
jgi:hypothetical protein